VGRLALKLLPLVALIAFGAWVAAPALSTQRYLPEAHDFEQPLPAVAKLAPAADASSAAKHGEEPVRYRSPVIDAPARFDLVGVAGEMRPLEYRARPAGGEWSDWIEAHSGDPVYFGGADQVQVRSRGIHPHGRLHYVNVSGSETAAQRALTGARETINSAFISVSSVTSAGAAPSEPDMVSRASWGANRDNGGCKPRNSPAYGKVKSAIVHHTVSANDYSADEAPGIVLGICRFHRNGNGWSDMGYNFLVDRFGKIYVGRAGGPSKAVVGAQAQGYNAQTTGASSIGTHTKRPIRDEAMDAFVRLLAWKLAFHGTRATGKTKLVSAGGSLNRYPSGKRIHVRRISGHGRFDKTACPGRALRHQLKEMRKLTQARIEGSAALVPRRADPPAYSAAR
jgi:hypothetical protein